MALKAILDSIDAVPETLKALYTKGDDGKYRLDVEDAEEAFASGLKKSKEEVLADLRRTQAKLKAYDGVDAEEFKRLKKAADDAAAEAAKTAGNWEAREKQLLDLHKAEVAKLATQNESNERFIQKLVVENALRSALEPVAVDVDLALPVFQRFVRSKKDETTGEWSGVVVDEKGNPRIADSTGAPLTIGKWIADAANDKKFAPLMKGSGAAGSGARGSGERQQGDVKMIGANDQKAFLDNMADIAKGKAVVAAA